MDYYNYINAKKERNRRAGGVESRKEKKRITGGQAGLDYNKS